MLPLDNGTIKSPKNQHACLLLSSALFKPNTFQPWPFQGQRGFFSAQQT